MRTFAKAAAAAAALGTAVVVSTPMLLRHAYNKKREKDKMGIVSAYTRKGFFAMMYSLVSESVDQKFHSVKEKLFEEVPEACDVLEIGPGVGANFKYYRNLKSLTAYEPNTHMHQQLREQASESGIKHFVLVGEGAEDLFESAIGKFDVVVSTLVLCSVKQPDVVLKNVETWLKPGGKFLFLEHVAEQKGTSMRWFQTFISPFTRFAFDGCHADRCSDCTIAAFPGFKAEVHEYYTPKDLFFWTQRNVYGVAVKA
uniref:Methyltransferase type 11 domain-containing protein n=1 Tax=Picocystis salinarum TaxID=88271 RepID=A0A7S3UG50_9CHLO